MKTLKEYKDHEALTKQWQQHIKLRTVTSFGVNSSRGKKKKCKIYNRNVTLPTCVEVLKSKIHLFPVMKERNEGKRAKR